MQAFHIWVTFKGARLATAWENWYGFCCWVVVFFLPLSLSHHSQFHVNELHWGCLIWSDYYAGWSHSPLQESTTLISGTQPWATQFCMDTEKNKSVLNFQASCASCLLNQYHSLWGRRETPWVPKSSKSEGRFLAPLASSLPSPHFSWHVCPLSVQLITLRIVLREDGEMAQQLRECVALSEVQGLVPNTHMADHNH